MSNEDMKDNRELEEMSQMMFDSLPSSPDYTDRTINSLEVDYRNKKYTDLLDIYIERIKRTVDFKKNMR